MVSFPFTQLQVTKSGSWPWLCGVRTERFAHSDTFGLVSLGQPTCAHTDTGSSVSPGNSTGNKKQLGLAPRCYQQRLLGLVGPLPAACRERERRKGKETFATTQRGQEAGDSWQRRARRSRCLSQGGPGCSPALPCPAHPISPSPIPTCSPCLCLGVWGLAPDSLEMMQNAIPK